LCSMPNNVQDAIPLEFIHDISLIFKEGLAVSLSSIASPIQLPIHLLHLANASLSVATSPRWTGISLIF